ncbi:MAG: phospho-2-dehydro-3-deoxyheptonate aldolase [Myxococcaceae bacterium]|nr:phospho-2-dehydro-3-deoxyheptonate aldolase [Myxococcaceae bacterium]
MIITLESGASTHDIEAVVTLARRFDGVEPKTYTFPGQGLTVTEVHLVGSTQAVPTDLFEELPSVRSVVRVSKKYRLIGRHTGTASHSFDYNGVRFGDHDVHVFAGLCAVDTRQHVEEVMAALQQHGIVTTRMGAYKPRTSPYDFQGLGASCLPWVFELAGKYGVKVIAMEVTDARHIEEIQQALEQSGRATGVMLQIGTRNAQNFELLKAVGQQRELPVLCKRGMGITLEESLNAAEYIASEGNPNIVFCLRGVKSHLGEPMRNLVDFAHVPVVRKLTRLPVCIDPSHSVGRADVAPDGIPYIFHVIAQGLIAGATNVLIDFHPRPETALCDGPQALTLDKLPLLMTYAERVRAAYLDLTKLF